MEDTQRQQLIAAFTTVLRASPLHGVVNQQQCAMAFASVLQQTPNGHPISLAPLAQHLAAQQIAADAVRDLMLVLKSREQRLGIAFVLPPALQNATAADIQRALQDYARRAATSTSGASRPAPGPRVGGTPAASDAAAAKAGPAKTPAKGAAAPAESTASRTPSRPEPRPSNRRIKVLPAMLVLCCIALVVSFVVDRINRVAPPRPLTLNATDTLPCAKTVSAKRIVICTLPLATYQAMDSATFKHQAEQTRDAIRAQGQSSLLVYTDDDRLVGSFGASTP